MKAFKSQQKEIRDIYNKICTKKQLTFEEFEKIKENLAYIHKDLSVQNQDNLNEMNKPLSGNHNEIPKGEYFINVFVHEDTTVSLWEELSNLAIKDVLLECPECHSLYKPTSKHRRKYCNNPNCGNNARQAKYLLKHQPS